MFSLSGKKALITGATGGAIYDYLDKNLLPRGQIVVTI
jgi:hypothetical protein